jgi:hypothetical protein
VQSKYSIDAGESLVRLQVWGELRAEELIRLMGRIGADPQHRADMAAIADLREAYGDWDYSEIQRFRDYVARIGASDECRWAAIVSPGALVAVAHVLIVISEPVATRIHMQLFEDFRSAMKWVKANPLPQKPRETALVR